MIFSPVIVIVRAVEFENIWKYLRVSVCNVTVSLAVPSPQLIVAVPEPAITIVTSPDFAVVIVICLSTALETVTVHVAVLLPSAVVAVIVADDGIVNSLQRGNAVGGGVGNGRFEE